MEETSERAEDPTLRTDRRAVDVACTEQNNTIAVYKLHWQNIWSKWQYMLHDLLSAIKF